MKEEWKDIEGYEGSYQVSSHGRVRSLDRVSINITRNGKPKPCKIKGRYLSCKPCNIGYPRVNLSKNGKDVKAHVHRLVATAFISNPDNLPNVNHKDANKLNNHITNLEWVTQSRNCEHAFDLNLNKHGEDHHAAKLSVKEVKEIIELYSTGNYSQRQLADMFSVCQTRISKITRREQWRRAICD